MHRDSRKIAAILAADVVDYSRLMAMDEPGTLATLKARRQLFDARVAEFGGLGFGSVGDSLMAEFPSAVNAVLCALDVQERVNQENESLDGSRRMRLRIGVHLGDVIEEGGTAFGDAVNVAARLQALAKPGGVLISGPVYDQVHLKIPSRFVDLGSRRVKNIPEPIRTYDVQPPVRRGLAAWLGAIFSRLHTRRGLRIAGGAIALVGIVAVAAFWRDIPLRDLLGRNGARAPPNSIAVLPFDNVSGDPANDYLGNGMAEELANRLARIPGLQVASRTSTFALKGKGLNVREIADRLGVAYIVEGSVQRELGLVRIKAALVERASDRRRWSNTYERSAGSIFQIESDIGTQVITALELVLGISSSEAAVPKQQATDVTHDLYLKGLASLRQPKSVRSLTTAEGFFKRALDEEPGFGRAQARLCETRVELYQLERKPEYVATAEEACLRAQALDSTAQEVYEAVGKLRIATGQPAEAEAAYRRALALVPQSPDVLIGLATALAAVGKPDAAEATLRRAIAAQPSYWLAHLQLGNFYFRSGRAREAIAPYERATELGPDDPNAFNNLGGAYIHLGEFDKAAEALSRSLAIEPRRGSYSNSGTVAYYRGRYAEAVQMFRKAIEHSPADNRLWGNLADALYFDGKREEATGAYRRALELVDGELAINPKHAINQALAAYYSVRLGQNERAVRSIQSALVDGDNSNDVHYYVAQAELGLGDRDSALAHARRARELGYPENVLRATPGLEGLTTNF
jgi:adenylate cyclase